MGKIIGIAMVGLTQFFLWILLTGVFLGVFQSGVFGNETKPALQMVGQQSQIIQQDVEAMQTEGASQFALVGEILGSINFQVMIFSFIFYFLGGYLLYSSLFAAIGGAVDHDADTQQFMLPVSIPLIFSVMMSGVIVNQPDSPLSFWMSMIPFTSPVTMMMRIPFGVPYWQLGLSMGLLVAGFIATTWMAGKIYKTGILMYGQKVTYLTMWKWLRNK